MFWIVVNNIISIAQQATGVNCYNQGMEITSLERAQVIINTLKARVHQLEENLLEERAAHALTVLSYQKEEAQASEGRRFVDG